MPGLLPLLIVFGIYTVIKRKKVNYGIISLAILLVSLAGSFIGLF
ncbi:MAG: PTS system mannose/fructose/sorbose family transporter subunit IID [Enterocloster bolteae]